MTDAFAERELLRWMRPDAHRFLRRDWRRQVKAGADIVPALALYEQKYRPDQPRVPAGSREGGQWAGEGSSSTSSSGEGSAPNGTGTEVAGRIPESRETECEEQYRKDTFICNLVQTQTCWAQAMFRRAKCLSGGYIPPLYH